MRKNILREIKLPDDIKNLTYEELYKLSEETREYIIDIISRNGGHLAPSLGVIELTIALLRVCNPLHDRIIWDVSHQSYPYKVLTDRLDKFNTIRLYGGISGFCKPSESPYDAFGTGHSSTSISAGYGMACHDLINGVKRKIISVIGDGALTGGMAFEAMNNLGNSKVPMVVILNDNEMSISPNVGALSRSLSRMLTGELANTLRDDVKKIVNSIPNKHLQSLAKKLEDSMVSFFTTGVLFEEFGLRYIGPIDGHKIKDMEKALNTAFNHNGPVLIHLATQKGKGYKPAEENPAGFHGVSSFNVGTGAPLKRSAKKSWTGFFSDKLLDLASKDKQVVAITCAMKDGTGLDEFSSKYPDRFFDEGIAEQHAMTFAAGMAISGMKPYIAIYSTFLQRAYDQLIHDVALQNLSVRICIDRAGLVGQDGATHHGAFDISYLRLVPNLTVMLPRDGKELEEMMELSLDWQGPLAIRYARGEAESFDNIPRKPVEKGLAEIIYNEGEVAIISAGHIFPEAYRFWQDLKKIGKSVSLINLRFTNTLDKKALADCLSDKKVIFTFEENVKSGGAGELIESIICENTIPAKVISMSLPDSFVGHGTVAELRKEVGLTAEAAMEKYMKLVVKDNENNSFINI